MPLQNRVTPLGELIADPARGLVYGNRGCLHDAHGKHRAAVPGEALDRLPARVQGPPAPAKQQPGRYTELFFLDEATAFAAGHRPCAECRRDDYNRFLQIVGETRADAIDERLHAERLAPYRGAPIDELPDGAFVLRDGEPWLVLGTRARCAGRPPATRERRARPRNGAATVVTPPSLLDVLRAGFTGAVPLLHPSARCR